jgi:hypothetical protein
MTCHGLQSVIFQTTALYITTAERTPYPAHIFPIAILAHIIKLHQLNGAEDIR